MCIKMASKLGFYLLNSDFSISLINHILGCHHVNLSKTVDLSKCLHVAVTLDNGKETDDNLVIIDSRLADTLTDSILPNLKPHPLDKYAPYINNKGYRNIGNIGIDLNITIPKIIKLGQAQIVMLSIITRLLQAGILNEKSYSLIWGDTSRIADKHNGSVKITLSNSVEYLDLCKIRLYIAHCMWPNGTSITCDWKTYNPAEQYVILRKDKV